MAVGVVGGIKDLQNPKNSRSTRILDPRVREPRRTDRLTKRNIKPRNLVYLGFQD